MTIQTTFYAAVNDDATVTTLVADRIYPLVAPDGAAVPYITYQVISTEAHNLIAGAPSTERKVIQCNCISNSYANAVAISAAVKASINAATGYLVGEGDDYFHQTENFRIRLDFSLIG